ncbi:MAG: sigma 54-interacting transcriptional regulator [Planctomycetia bacterium]
MPASADPPTVPGSPPPPPAPAAAGVANSPPSGSSHGNRWARLPGASTAMRNLEDAVARVAGFECPTLITGETGCGKEEIARAIHLASPRRDKPFVTVNCGGVVASLAESQLFGHEKGSFTGASGTSRGVFRSADGGIVFLDEIGELPLDLQPKLLRVLQRGEVTPVGSVEAFQVNVVVIAATNRNLEADVEAGLFREDLFYRLNTVHLRVPPLRCRPEDIPRFIEHFSSHFARLYGLPQWAPDLATLARLMGYPWPGNVRQLAQTIQRIYIFNDRVDDVLDDVLGEQPVPEATAEAPAPIGLSPPAGAPPAASRPLFESATKNLPLLPPAIVPAPAVVVPALHRGLASAPAIAGLTVPDHPPEPVPPEEQVPSFNLDALRCMAVRQALAVTGGHRSRAAKLLGVSASRMSRLAAEVCPESVARTGRRRGMPRKPR